MNFRLSELKELVDDNFKFNENGLKFSEQVEDTVGKREIVHNEKFLFFPQFSTVFLPFSSNFELPDAISSSLEESKICRLGKG